MYDFSLEELLNKITQNMKIINVIYVTFLYSIIYLFIYLFFIHKL